MTEEEIEFQNALRHLEGAERELNRHVFWIGGPYRLNVTIAEGQAAERRYERAMDRFLEAENAIKSYPTN